MIAKIPKISPTPEDQFKTFAIIDMDDVKAAGATDSQVATYDRLGNRLDRLRTMIETHPDPSRVQDAKADLCETGQQLDAAEIPLVAAALKAGLKKMREAAEGGKPE